MALWLVGALLLWAGVALIERAGIGATIVILPGALMFGMGAKSLYRACRGSDEPLCPTPLPEAEIIPFPRQPR